MEKLMKIIGRVLYICFGFVPIYLAFYIGEQEVRWWQSILIFIGGFILIMSQRMFEEEDDEERQENNL